jgi:hypothetical protein
MSCTEHNELNVSMGINERHRTDRSRRPGYSGRSSRDVIAGADTTLAGNAADDSTDDKEIP